MVSFVFCLESTSDLEEVMKRTIKEKGLSGDLDLVLKFLINLKKGNLFKLINHYQSDLDYLESLNVYDRVCYFKSFCKDLQLLVKTALNLNDSSLTKDELKLDESEALLENVLEKAEDEMLELAFEK